MYNNIGGKIKGLAVVIAILGTVISIIMGILFFNLFQIVIEKNGLRFLVSFLLAICGAIISWILSWALFGYGELIDDVSAIRYNTSCIPSYVKSAKKSKDTEQAFTFKNTADKEAVECWSCEKCRSKNLMSRSSCWNCGAQKDSQIL